MPDRFLDTRNGTGGWLGALGAGQVVQVPIGGANGVPPGATAAVLNVTVTSAQAPGYLVAFPCDAPVPDASNLNFVAGDTVPNLVVVRLAGNGQVCLQVEHPRPTSWPTWPAGSPRRRSTSLGPPAAAAAR